MAVYIIGHRPVASKVKIGSAADPEARLRGISLSTDRTAIPADVDRTTLQLLHCFDDGDWAMEHWLHGEFGKARDVGEWFRLGGNVDEVVRRISNAVGRFREGRRRFEGVSEKPPMRQALDGVPKKPEKPPTQQTLTGDEWRAHLASRRVKTQVKTQKVQHVQGDLLPPAPGLTEFEIRASERELLADLLESRYWQAPNADQREALRAILELYRPETWRSGREAS